MITVYPGRVVIADFPVPPSSNHQYMICTGKLKRSGKMGAWQAPSPELKDYHKDCETWHWKNMRGVAQAKKWLSDAAYRMEFARKPAVFKVECFVGFEVSRLFTIGGEPKVMDASNRIKALHDQLAKVLDRDDKVFWSVTSEKCIAVPGEPERVIVNIEECHVRSMSHVLSTLEAQ